MFVIVVSSSNEYFPKRSEEILELLALDAMTRWAVDCRDNYEAHVLRNSDGGGLQVCRCSAFGFCVSACS